MSSTSQARQEDKNKFGFDSDGLALGGYSWEIDDIQIYETPANDLRIDNYVSYTDYFTTGVYEAGVFAAGQLSELQAAAKVYNVGYLDQEGSTLALEREWE